MNTARGDPAQHTGLEIKCALWQTTINSLAGKIAPATVAALLKEREWTLPQALAYARQVPAPLSRAQVLGAMIWQATEPLPAEVFEELFGCLGREDVPPSEQGFE